MACCKRIMLELFQKYNHMARLGIFHTMAFGITLKLGKFEWCSISVLSLMTNQSIRNF